MDAEKKRRPGLLQIGLELSRQGAFAFGGLGATLSLLQSSLVARRQWIQQSDISEALAFTKALPGSTGIQVVAYLGWLIRGWPGALVATISFIAPAMMLMIVVAAGSLVLTGQIWVQGALTGIQVAVVGLVAAAMWRLARSEAKTPLLVIVLLAGAVSGFFVHALIVVVVAGLVGALLPGERSDG